MSDNLDSRFNNGSQNYEHENRGRIESLLRHTVLLLEKRRLNAIKQREALDNLRCLSEARKVFERLSRSRYEGVPGIVRIDGKKPGPTVGITVCTHGNEPSGLAAADFLFNTVARKKELLSGTVYVVLNNVLAADRYFNARTAEEKRTARFADVNMNRLPPDALERKQDTRYEIKRIRALSPIVERFDVGLDIHSTSQDSAPMIIALGNEIPKDLIQGMPIRKILSNIDAVQKGKPASYFYGPKDGSGIKLGIETGSHEKSSSFERAKLCAEALLQNLGMLAGKPQPVSAPYEEYPVTSSVLFPDDSYELTREFPNFECVPKGTLLARGNGPDLVAKANQCTLFASGTKPVSLSEEALFLSDPVRTHQAR